MRCSCHQFFQFLGHENTIGCNKSASNPDAEPQAVDLPTAVGDLSQLLLSTATEAATSIAPTRPKRTSLSSYSATSAVILPPSPERAAKRARALIVERTAAVQAAEEATSDLVTRFQKLKTCYDSAKLKIEALEVERNCGVEAK